MLFNLMKVIILYKTLCDTSLSLVNSFVIVEDCYNIASDYKGTIDKTAGGVSCQLWSENFPHEHEFHDDATFPESNVTAASNYCRSPDNGTVPWCYTNDTDVRWDYCNVPICRDCITNDSTLYRGTVAKTRNGTDCQHWSTDTPNRHQYHDDEMFADGSVAAARNYCRVPENGTTPWCYTNDTNIRWDYCDVPDCRDCYNVAMLYRGTAAWTTNGKACQKWSDNSPQKHKYHEESMFPDGSVAAAYNYCRAPDNGTAPWCYTEDGSVRWDYCDVQMCHDCYNIASDYNGTLAHTVDGIICQRWSENIPHEHKYHDDSLFPENSVTMAHNYCRSPENGTVPWCYTRDARVRWSYCDAPRCKVCDEDEFTCFDGSCIPSEYRCDGTYADCKGAEDEKDCDCTEDQFSCDDGRCIMNEYRCDGNIHCRDTTDEMNCPAELHKGFIIHNLTTETGEAESAHRWHGKDTARTETYCQSNELPCASVLGCIPRAWFCDGERDCEDGSDEGTHCSNIWWKYRDFDQPVCTDDQFRCDYGRCIPKQFRCDGDFDCPYDFSDELHCHKKGSSGKTRCAQSEIPCSSSGRCVPRAWLCDGDVDCENGTDEGPHCNYPRCSDSEFQCDNGYCIPLTLRCNHHDDCPQDDSDERNCDVPKDLADVSDNVKIVAIVIPDAVAIVIAVVSVIVTVLIVAFVIFRVRKKGRMRTCSANETQATRDRLTVNDGKTYQEVQLSESYEMSKSKPKKFTFEEMKPLESEKLSEPPPEKPKSLESSSKLETDEHVTIAPMSKKPKLFERISQSDGHLTVVPDSPEVPGLTKLSEEDALLKAMSETSPTDFD